MPDTARARAARTPAPVRASSTAAMSGEEWSNLLNRFEKWSQGQSGDGRTGLREVGAHPEEAQEISYEEALTAARGKRNRSGSGTAGEAPAVTGRRSAGGKAAAAPPAMQGDIVPRPEAEPVSPEDFPQALARSLAESPAGGLQPRQEARTRLLSIRLSAPEYARLSRNAKKANLPVSAYARQCALESETLREQVRMAMRQLSSAQAASEPARELPAPSAPVLHALDRGAPGFLERIAARCGRFFPQARRPGWDA